MPFVVRADSTAATADPRRAFVLAPGRLADDRLSIELLSLPASDSIEISTDDGELAWLQVLSGDCRLDADPLTPGCIAMLARGAVATLTADATARVLAARVPRAVDYDDRLARLARVLVDWTTEPVLSSEHDARRRIYLASPRLWGTSAVKGEMIIYPPDCSGAAHHHVGAEHFQYLLSGAGVAVLGDTEVPLAAGDLLYNFENELHWFRNDGPADMVFVEFFVPGESTTVWAPGAHACGWEPTGHDIKGREPSRQLSYHIHGQGDV